MDDIPTSASRCRRKYNKRAVLPKPRALTDNGKIVMRNEALKFIENMITVDPTVVYLLIAYFFVNRVCKTIEIYFKTSK